MIQCHQKKNLMFCFLKTFLRCYLRIYKWSFFLYMSGWTVERHSPTFVCRRCRLGVCEIVIPSIKGRRRRKTWVIRWSRLGDYPSGKLTTLDLLLTKSLTLSKSESGTGESLCTCRCLFVFELNKFELRFSLLNFNRYFSIVRNRYLYIHLFPEPSPVSKDQPPFARFILLVSDAGSSHSFHISPGTYMH